MAARVIERLNASIIIPCRNGALVLPHQLEALSTQANGPQFEVIVVDNGSTDGTTDVALGWMAALPNLRVLHAPRRGLGHARNAGLGTAEGELVLFCDADDVVAPRWVIEMCAQLGRHDLVGGTLDFESLNDAKTVEWRRGTLPSGLPISMRFLPYAVGANLGVRRSVAVAVGGFAERYRRSHDDVEFCWRAQLQGFSLGYASRAIVAYRFRSSYRSLASQRFNYGRDYVRLYCEYRQLATLSPSLPEELKVAGDLMATGLRARTSADFGRWLCSAAWHTGRWLGGLEHGVLCPSD